MDIKPKVMNFPLLSNLLDTILPRSCAACNRLLNPWEEELCLLCLMEMPVRPFHEDPENPVAKVFWGRVPLEQASTWFVYIQGSRFGNLLHRLKYENRPQIGVVVGRYYGWVLKEAVSYRIPDLIIPVPLHPKRQRRRGYNQSEMFAKGLSAAMDIPYSSGVLLRTEHTLTQTAKSRAERYLNVKGKFRIGDIEAIQNKHVLLVDDVITTGATLEACAEVLLQVEGVSVSVAGIAFAEKRG